MNSTPAFRRLRGYAFDPSLSLDMDTFDVNNIVYKVRWEESGEEEDGFGPGPVGEYVEVIDYDPTVGKVYSPVDLDDPHVLATEGLAPSESNPQFHQQMVYAVAMLTIQNFERALGRKIHWATRLRSKGKEYESYVPRLRIYPHALREPNAFYSPHKKALLFGYFAATPARVEDQMPGSLVFTCLSHDIIAHEVTHAILDGLHRNYNSPTNPDVLAFHEAFADIVALFQHFTFPEVLRHQIAKTRGELDKQNLLGELAQQFGTSIGRYGSLRSALGQVDPDTGEWQAAEPNPADYITTLEPHARGSILVGAVFDAFLAVYKRRISDLRRIASGGSGLLAEGDLHPDLVNRLAVEASKTASHVLRMCIRALDYCPPMDITFGDYLRAIITADYDAVAEDERSYRLAFINAFRRRGIFPENIKMLSEDSLRYPTWEGRLYPKADEVVKKLSDFLREFYDKVVHITDRESLYRETQSFIAGGPRHKGLHRLLADSVSGDPEILEQFQQLSGLVMESCWDEYGIRTSSRGGPSYQVLDLHVVSRAGPEGEHVNQIVFGLVQRMGVIAKDDGSFEHYQPPSRNVDSQVEPPDGGFEVLGGCTLVFDLIRQKLRYAIAKPLLDPVRRDDNGWPEINARRVRAQRRYQRETLRLGMSAVANYFGGGGEVEFGEPFALLHSKEPRDA